MKFQSVIENFPKSAHHDIVNHEFSFLCVKGCIIFLADNLGSSLSLKKKKCSRFCNNVKFLYIFYSLYGLLNFAYIYVLLFCCFHDRSNSSTLVWPVWESRFIVSKVFVWSDEISIPLKSSLNDLHELFHLAIHLVNPFSQTVKDTIFYTLSSVRNSSSSCFYTPSHLAFYN